MEETRIQIGDDVLLDIGTHSDWFISEVGYNGESVDVVLRRKADIDKECKWLADTPQTWPIPDACKTCSNHPSNGGSGICHCMLGNIEVKY